MLVPPLCINRLRKGGASRNEALSTLNTKGGGSSNFGFDRGPLSAEDTELLFESDELCHPARFFSTARKIEDTPIINVVKSGASRNEYYLHLYLYICIYLYISIYIRLPISISILTPPAFSAALSLSLYIYICVYIYIY